MAASAASSTGSELGIPHPSSASSAIDTQLRTLCLHEFPCGLGSWREPNPKSFKPARSSRAKIKPLHLKSKKEKSTDSLDSKVLVSMEKSEALQEMVSSPFSPWHLDYSWSEEAKDLREIAVKSPWLIDQNFVLNYFKTLRIVDKNVADVDENLLMLANLEELTLSANHISNVNSKNLPPSLKVLELCANKISDISGLCVRPPLLRHLGLGYNKIAFTGDYITGDFWPNLLSLDLSFNDLCDLMDTVRKLITLPNLRNLVMQGCPLCLIPSYRGYTIDSLRRLTIMDDVHISADEKHHFKGLARRREFILDEARVKLGVTYIKGLPCPEEIKNPESQPEFPIVERRYFVQFMFPEDHVVRTAEGAEGADQIQALELEMEAAAGGLEHQEQQEELGAECAAVTTSRSAPVESPPPTDRRVEINSRPEVKSLAQPSTSSQISFPRADPNPDHPVAGSDVEGFSLDLVEESIAGEAEAEGEETRRQMEAETEEVKPEPIIKLAPVNSDPMPWAEEIEVNWSTDLTRDDLLTLRNFFQMGMDFNVVESVVLGYPAEPNDNNNAEKDPKEVKGKKPEPAAAKGGKGSAKEKKKGKKEPEIELVKSPATYTTIATFHTSLEHFLEGEFEYQNIFTKGDVPPPSTIRSMEPDDKKKKYSIGGSRSPSRSDIRAGSRSGSHAGSLTALKKSTSKIGSARSIQTRSAASLKDVHDESNNSTGGSAVDKKDSKDKKKGADKGADKKKDKNDNAKKSPRDAKKPVGKGKQEEAEEDEGPPPPLELEVTVSLHHWTTAMDSVREEEERTKQLMEAKSKEMGSKDQLSTTRKDTSMGSKEQLTSRKGSNR